MARTRPDGVRGAVPARLQPAARHPAVQRRGGGAGQLGRRRCLRAGGPAHPAGLTRPRRLQEYSLVFAFFLPSGAAAAGPVRCARRSG
ncbi:hypothetical protein CBM2599_B120171 [Cupriavidus taiwanensis]|nr:hypothetical protein CBM2599_B120171 [Cupriavidus taiwanensis]SOY98370.1 hypothetical protein CBM2600_B130171 [Cupriavidus taiwanensis]